jgi:hypothetical protein
VWRVAFRFIAAVTAFSAAMYVLPSAYAARTGFVVFDGFEDNPAASWSFAGDGTHYGDFGHDLGSPHSGSQLAWLNVFGPGWSSVGREVQIDTSAYTPSTCSASFYLLSVTDSLVNVEVIDPSTWTYVTVQQVQAGPDWASYSSGWWTPGATDVFVRVSVLGTGGGDTEDRVMVDDMQVRCY